MGLNFMQMQRQTLLNHQTFSPSQNHRQSKKSECGHNLVTAALEELNNPPSSRMGMTSCHHYFLSLKYTGEQHER